MRTLKLGLIIVLSMLIHTHADAGGVITIDNQSPFAIKAVAPGGSALIESASEPVSVAFDNDKPVGVTLRIWWVSKPLELCQIYTPWDRTVTVSGKNQIICLSQQ